jgi:hypothetical protein
LKRRGLWPLLRDRAPEDAPSPPSEQAAENAARASAPADHPGFMETFQALTPLEILRLFTAGWLGGQGLLAVIDRYNGWPDKALGAAELVAAALWFVPRLRQAGFGAMLAVLAVDAVREFVSGRLPGALIFYGAITLYLAVEEERSRKAW